MVRGDGHGTEKVRFGSGLERLNLHLVYLGYDIGMLIRHPISGLWDAFSANCVPVRRPLTINMVGAILGFKSFSEIRFMKGDVDLRNEASP